MRMVMAVAGAVVAAALIVPTLVASRQDAPAKPSVAARERPAPDTTPVLSGTLRVPDRGDGHYQVEARIGARRIPFLIDTGATIVALTWDTGRDLGLVSASDTMDVALSTANGTVRGKSVLIPRLDIESLTVRDVRGVVMPQGALSSNLLGMSFLGRLRQFTVARNTLILEQ
jgi:aspartyl protease family protein